jgi:ABC-type phosphate/phosphonate transport system permease subunit
MQSRSQFFSLSTAAAVGFSLSIAEVYALGFLAARPYPHWYVSVLQDHKHLRYELWGVVAMAAPVALLAATFGVALALLAKKYSMTVPLVAVGAWLFCRLVLVPLLWDEPISALGDEIRYVPVSMLAGVVLPALALSFAYRRMTRPPLNCT